jgi:carboxylate-amine ligase
MRAAEKPSLIPANAFQTGAPGGTLGAEEELWLADPGTLKLAGGAQKILASEPEDRFSGELIDCEIEANTGVHPQPGGVARDLLDRRRVLLGHADGSGGSSGRAGRTRLGTGGSRRSSRSPTTSASRRSSGG